MELLSVHTSWLIPGEKTPCDIYFYFRGTYVVALKQSTEISLDFMSKLLKTEYPLAYVAKDKEALWTAWTNNRHPHLLEKQESIASPAENKKKQLYGNKRAEFVSYAQKSIIPRDSTKPNSGVSGINNADMIENAVAAIEQAIQGPTWDWYFEQFHEPPDLFYHAGRVTIMATLLAISSDTLSDSELETLILSTLIHEIQGDPSKSFGTVISEQTLKIMSDEKRPIAKEIIDQIRMQDELVNGNGFPNKLKGDQISNIIKIFTLANHLDHYRIKAIASSRRAKLDLCKKSMTARKADYDSMLWDQFWKMLEQDFEVVA
jgi:HD-GYP domain-containing protein (c-di-GMP phosphodiesterase class II)